jgi:hypothetical protein
MLCRFFLIQIIFLCLLPQTFLFGQDSSFELSREEISKRISELPPADEDFKFEIPSGWTTNLMNNSQILMISHGESIDSAKKIIDGLPSTTWTSNTYKKDMEIVIDLGAEKMFNRLVIFNLHTEERGTGGGNNATKALRVYISKINDADYFILLNEFILSGPNAICFKVTGGGQICSFVDRKEPNIFTLKEVRARFIKLLLQKAYWNEFVPNPWKSYFSLSEVMLFFAK